MGQPILGSRLAELAGQSLARLGFLLAIACGTLTLLPIPCLQADELSDLKAQMADMQQENKTLHDQVGRLLSRIEALERANVKAEPSAEQIAQTRRTVVEPGSELESLTLGAVDLPRLRIQGFGNVLLQQAWEKVDNSDSFSLGSIDLYMNSEITDRVSAMVEADFGGNTDTNGETFFLQRADVKYSYSDWLNVTVGKLHTPFGHWNQAYHHGFWTQLTIRRPDIVAFEFGNGFLPVHAVGVDVSGVKDFEFGDVGYDLGVFNGRGRTITEIAHVKDKNDGKAVIVHLFVKPDLVEGLTLGGNFYGDEIPSNPPTASRLKKIDEWIVGEYATYERFGWQVLSEMYEIYHQDHTSGNHFNSIGAYVQVGYRSRRCIPYYRLDLIDVADGDPYFTAPRNIDRTRHTWGLRWNVLPWNALKLEYSFADMRQNANEHLLGADWSFAF